MQKLRVFEQYFGSMQRRCRNCASPKYFVFTSPIKVEGVEAENILFSNQKYIPESYSCPSTPPLLRGGEDAKDQHRRRQKSVLYAARCRFCHPQWKYDISRLYHVKRPITPFSSFSSVQRRLLRYRFYARSGAIDAILKIIYCLQSILKCCCLHSAG
jgi:hypothetical protein